MIQAFQTFYVKKVDKPGLKIIFGPWSVMLTGQSNFKLGHVSFLTGQNISMICCFDVLQSIYAHQNGNETK